MKMKKIIATLLSLALIVGVASACGDTATDETTEAAADTTEAAADETEAAETEAADETEAEATEAEEESSMPEDLVEPATNLEDEDDTVVIYSWNEEFQGLLDSYYAESNSDFNYDYQITESTTYQTKLDSVLASGDSAPDIFLVEADYAKKYVDSEYTLNINEVGISYSELSEQYPYTYEFMTSSDGAIKALSWQACPAGVFYNRSLAIEYLGTDDPEEVGEYFADWDTFMALCEQINEDSDGTVKAISGYDDIWRSFQNTREEGWLVDGEITIDSAIEEYFDYAKQLTDEDLTFETTQWNTDWTANMANETVLSYWGPMWLLNFSMGFGYEDDGETVAEDANATTGDWGYCNAPVSYFWGGTWICASSYDNNLATTADIMRFFTIDEDSVSELAYDGEFVNNVSIMTEIANDDSFGVAYLGGQNPFGDLVEAASSIDVSTITGEDQAINDIFTSTVTAYTSGEIETVAEAEAAFIADCQDAGIGA